MPALSDRFRAKRPGNDRIQRNGALSGICSGEALQLRSVLTMTLPGYGLVGSTRFVLIRDFRMSLAARFRTIGYRLANSRYSSGTIDRSTWIKTRSAGTNLRVPKRK